jgi:hypothetical protein
MSIGSQRRGTLPAPAFKAAPSGRARRACMNQNQACSTSSKGSPLNEVPTLDLRFSRLILPPLRENFCLIYLK